MPHAIQIRQTGAPEVLNWTAVDVGEPGSGQVRLRQAAAGKPRGLPETDPFRVPHGEVSVRHRWRLMSCCNRIDFMH
jgi:hypothetical protein